MRALKFFVVTCTALSGLTLGATGIVHAQEAVTSDDLFDSAEYPVRERPRPDYDAMGIRSGAWLIFPSLTTELYYDSNVEAVTSGGTSSAVALFQPRLLVSSDFSRHAVNVEFGADYKAIFEKSEANIFTGFAKADARIDVQSDFTIDATAKIEANQADLGASSSPGTAKNGVRHLLLEGSLGATKAFNRVTASTTGTVTHYDYYDVDAIGGGKLDQDNRDGTEFAAIAKLAYLLAPEYSAFVSVEGNWRDWAPSGTANKDSNGYEVLGGVEFSINRLLLGSVGVGYMYQDYENSSLKDIGTFSYSGNLTWMPTPLATVNLSGRRKVEESTAAGASGIVSSTAEVSVDFEARRNIIVSPNASYTHEKYKGTTQTDKTMVLGLRADYLVNRNFKVGAKYVFEKRDSNAANSDYTKHVVGIYAKAEY